MIATFFAPYSASAPGSSVKAILANGVVAHSNRAHSNLLSFDKVLTGILLQEKVHGRKKISNV